MMIPEDLIPECPHCHIRIGGHTAVNGPVELQPTPGCICLCAECGYILVFVGPELRLATTRDLAQLDRGETQALARAIAFYYFYKSNK